MIKAIVISGLICSGKTTLANHYSNKYHWDKISFGSYIKSIAEKRQVPQNRHNLQHIGYEVFKNNDPRDFLIQVINFNKPNSYIHIYDSIRHLDMLSEVQKYYEDALIFYIKVDENIRYDRYIKKYGENITFPQFKKINEHPIEKGISEMVSKSDYIFDGSRKTNDLIDEVNSILKNHGYIDHEI